VLRVPVAPRAAALRSLEACTVARHRAHLESGVQGGPSRLRAHVRVAAQEAMAMAAAGMHANVVRYYGAWTEDAPGEAGRHVYILMEPCAESLGMRRIVCKAPLREAELLDVLRQARPPRRGHPVACACSLALAARCMACRRVV